MTVEYLFTLIPKKLLNFIARKLFKLRPLHPYPGWNFGIPEKDKSLMTKLRYALWKACHDSKSQRSIVIPWYENTRMHLYLGNDVSYCIFVGGCIEPNEFAFMSQIIKPGMVFIDIGANEGIYTVFASSCVGREGMILAIEPSSREFERLEKNIRLNQFENVLTRKVALSDRSGEGELLIAGYEHEGQNTLGNFIYKDIKLDHVEKVKLTILDDLIKETNLTRVDIVKIDCEGAETAVIKGAWNTINMFKPLLQIEVQDTLLRKQGSSRDELLHLLEKLEYKIFHFTLNTGRPVKVGLNEGLSENILAVHRSQKWNGLNHA